MSDRQTIVLIGLGDTAQTRILASIRYELFKTKTLLSQESASDGIEHYEVRHGYLRPDNKLATKITFVNKQRGLLTITIADGHLSPKEYINIIKEMRVRQSA